MSDNHVYHFTDTARLPWILATNELQPGRNKLGGFPSPDFLWATTSNRGDRTASANLDAYRRGVTRIVRFTLRADDFDTWPGITSCHPEWTQMHVEELERLAAQMGEREAATRWRARSAPLPRASWVAIETKAFANSTWRPLDLATTPITFDLAMQGGMLGVVIEGKAFFSGQREGPGGALGYELMPPLDGWGDVAA